MKLNSFMIIYAVVTGLFGLGFVLAPGLILPIYGVTPDSALKLIAQLFGAVLISLALLGWWVREFSDPGARRAVVSALLAGEAIGLILALLGQINGVLNVLGWSVIIVYLFFTLGLVYFRFLRE